LIEWRCAERFEGCNRSHLSPSAEEPGRLPANPVISCSPLIVSIVGLAAGTRQALLRLPRQQRSQRQEDIMFSWAIAFLVIALIAGALGFGIVAGTAFAAAKVVFVVALIAFLISGVLGVTGRGIP
jgi:uncharacterized membrane protein YtjA (UPF0391 family)